MKALIIGAGIAGTATALALEKVGIESELYEARPASEAGTGAPTGMQRIEPKMSSVQNANSA